MKQIIAWPLMAAMLLSLCCACAAPRVTDIPEGDGYVPVAGLSFGMSLEDAKKIYPNLQDSYIAEIFPGERATIPPPGAILDELRARYPQIDDQLLEDVEVYGQKATVQLRFTSWEDPGYNDYWHDKGLEEVLVTFGESVDEDAVIEHLEETYDNEGMSRTTSSSSAGETTSYIWYFKSKASAGDLELETIRDHMSHWLFTRKSDGEQITADCSFLVDRYLNGNITFNLKDFVVVRFNPEAKRVRFIGMLAAFLYAARADQHGNED